MSDIGYIATSAANTAQNLPSSMTLNACGLGSLLPIGSTIRIQGIAYRVIAHSFDGQSIQVWAE